MSLTAIAVSLALLTSLLPLLLIALRDPKRLRSRATASQQLAPMGISARRVLALTVLLPGAVLIGWGYWPAFLIWLGGLIASGWLMVQLLAMRRG